MGTVASQVPETGASVVLAEPAPVRRELEEDTRALILSGSLLPSPPPSPPVPKIPPLPASVR